MQPQVGPLALPQVLPLSALAGGTTFPSSDVVAEACILTIFKRVEEKDLALDNNQRMIRNQRMIKI